MIGGNQEGNVANGLWCGAGGNFAGLILMRHVTKKEVEVSAVELWCMWERLGKHQGLAREESVDGTFLSRHQIMCGSVTKYSRWPLRCKQRGLEPD
jgi:hypothetical protein